MRGPAGATRGVPKVSTNRGFMIMGTSFTEGTARTTLNASIPDVERLSQAIHLDESTPEGFCSLALRNVFETVVCYDSAREDRNLHLSR